MNQSSVLLLLFLGRDLLASSKLFEKAWELLFCP